MGAFDYPAVAHSRQHGPSGYADLSDYRPWLRDEFTFRCVYCLSREKWIGERGHFHIEHVVAQVRAPERRMDYDNLVYACASCNLAKGSKDTPDPCTTMIAQAVRVSAEGEILTTSPAAQKTVDLLGLNDPEFIDFRARVLRVVELARLHGPDLVADLLGFPESLPDLTRRSPPDNSRPGGVHNCYFQRRRRNELPTTY